jgi:hypothetical protein
MINLLFLNKMLRPLISFIAISRWDIIAERLGFMLVFGDLVFIPFTFTIQVYTLFTLLMANVDP